MEDIIYELDNQIKPLEKQSQVAKQFLELDEKRQQLYLEVLVAQIEKGRSLLTEKEEALTQVKADLTSYYEQRDNLELENQTLKQERHKLSESLEKEQALLLDLTRLISDLERKQALYELESSQNESSKQEAQERLLGQERGLAERKRFSRNSEKLDKQPENIGKSTITPI